MILLSLSSWYGPMELEIYLKHLSNVEFYLDFMSVSIIFKTVEDAHTPEAFHFLPDQLSHLITVIYPNGVPEDLLGKYTMQNYEYLHHYYIVSGRLDDRLDVRL